MCWVGLRLMVVSIGSSKTVQTVLWGTSWQDVISKWWINNSFCACYHSVVISKSFPSTYKEQQCLHGRWKLMVSYFKSFQVLLLSNPDQTATSLMTHKELTKASTRCTKCPWRCISASSHERCNESLLHRQEEYKCKIDFLILKCPCLFVCLSVTTEAVIIPQGRPSRGPTAVINSWQWNNATLKTGPV